MLGVLLISILLTACNQEVEFTIVEDTDNVVGKVFYATITTDANTIKEIKNIQKELKQTYQEYDYNLISIQVRGNITESEPYGEYKGTLKIAYNQSGKAFFNEDDNGRMWVFEKSTLED